MTALGVLLQALSGMKIRKVLHGGGWLAVRVDPAVYLTATKWIHQQWPTHREAVP